MNEGGVKKTIIPIAGLGTRFLPISSVLPKELFPLVDLPVLQYILQETSVSGIKEIVFVSRPEKKLVLDYFKKKIASKKILGARYKNHFLEELKNLENLGGNLSFSQVFQKKPLGDGHALLQAKKIIKNEAFGVCYADDVIESKTPCLLQLIKVFKKYQKPVIGVARVPKESFQFYGMIEGEKIEKRVFRIKKIIEKPSAKEAPSNLALVGRYVLTPEVFEYLEKGRKNKKGEIILNEALNKKITEGKEFLACQFEGKWLECGNKLAYLKSNFYLSLKHPKFGKELKKFLEKTKSSRF